MTTLHDHLMLLVAEAAGSSGSLQTVSSLMQTSRHVHKLLTTHQRSMIKNMLDNTPYPTDLLPPSQRLLSSRDTSQEVIQPETFKMVQEINIRLHRTAAILSPGSPLMDAARDMGMLPDHPTLEARMELHRRLARACAVTDRLADCAAEIMYQRSLTHQQEKYPVTVQNGHTNTITWTNTDSDEWEPRPCLTCSIRQKQLSFLCNDLDATDLAFLLRLLGLAGMAYARHVLAPEELESDPTAWDRVSAFKEAVMRHGTMALWTLLSSPPRASGVGVKTDNLPPLVPATVAQGSGKGSGKQRPSKEMTVFVSRAVGEIVGEIYVWEMGTSHHMLPGLHMTMVTAFKKQLNGGKDEEDEDDADGCQVWTEVDKIIAATIQGKSEEPQNDGGKEGEGEGEVEGKE